MVMNSLNFQEINWKYSVSTSKLKLISRCFSFQYFFSRKAYFWMRTMKILNLFQFLRKLAQLRWLFAWNRYEILNHDQKSSSVFWFYQVSSSQWLNASLISMQIILYNLLWFPFYVAWPATWSKFQRMTF